jgi:chromodomain-helicase-DNA-binding protein 4
MASTDHVSDSEDSPDAVDLIQAPKKKKNNAKPSLSRSGLSHRFRASPQMPRDEKPRARNCTSEEKTIAVMVQGPSRPWEYQPFLGDKTVDIVLAEVDQPGGEVWYRIEYEDGRREDVSIGTFHFVF